MKGPPLYIIFLILQELILFVNRYFSFFNISPRHNLVNLNKNPFGQRPNGWCSGGDSRKLGFVKPRVTSSLRKQGFVGAFLHHPPLIDYNDFIRITDGGKPVRDD